MEADAVRQDCSARVKGGAGHYGEVTNLIRPVRRRRTASVRLRVAVRIRYSPGVRTQGIEDLYCGAKILLIVGDHEAGIHGANGSDDHIQGASRLTFDGSFCHQAGPLQGCRFVEREHPLPEQCLRPAWAGEPVFQGTFLAPLGHLESIRKERTKIAGKDVGVGGLHCRGAQVLCGRGRLGRLAIVKNLSKGPSLRERRSGDGRSPQRIVAIRSLFVLIGSGAGKPQRPSGPVAEGVQQTHWEIHKGRGLTRRVMGPG
jgi:hypothetical protein